MITFVVWLFHFYIKLGLRRRIQNLSMYLLKTQYVTALLTGTDTYTIAHLKSRRGRFRQVTRHTLCRVTVSFSWMQTFLGSRPVCVDQSITCTIPIFFSVFFLDSTGRISLFSSVGLILITRNRLTDRSAYEATGNYIEQDVGLN